MKVNPGLSLSSVQWLYVAVGLHFDGYYSNSRKIPNENNEPIENEVKATWLLSAITVILIAVLGFIFNIVAIRNRYKNKFYLTLWYSSTCNWSWDSNC